MSYCRWNWPDEEQCCVHIIRTDTHRFHCLDREGTLHDKPFKTDDLQEILDHVDEHKAVGQGVPDWAIENLKSGHGG